MATAPWRCSQCGTINEPVANSCRTCGKWPSLFDLEDSAVDEDEYAPLSAPEPVSAPEQEPTYEAPQPVQTHEAPEPVTVDVETFEEGESSPRRRRFEPPPTDPVLDEGEGDRPRWVSWIIPLAVVVYFVLSYAFSGR
jgi:hypothetical protein